MKKSLIKMGVTLFLVAVTVAALVLSSLPVISQAAGGTTYNVTILSGSPLLTISSVNGSAAGPQVTKLDGVSFKMVVDAKAKTEKLKTGTATYYPVTIIAKSYKAPTLKFMMPGGEAIQSSSMPKDAKGKLYTSGGDVDVSVVVGAKKAVATIGDGKVDPAGSMIIPSYTTTSVIASTSTGKAFMTTTTIVNLTTGQSSLIVKGTKTRLEGKELPAGDTTKSLSNPLVGKPVDLNAGTGALVGTMAALGIKNKVVGTTDYIGGQIFVMQISK
jgi:hypothetical protein